MEEQEFGVFIEAASQAVEQCWQATSHLLSTEDRERLEDILDSFFSEILDSGG